MDNPPDSFSDWKWQLKNRITSLEKLEKIVNLTVEEKRAIQNCNNSLLCRSYG